MKKNIILLSLTILIIFSFLEVFVRVYYTQNVNGYLLEQNKSGLWIQKKNFTYYDYINKKKITYNSGNYRNRITTPNNKKKHKILILGDSFTYGFKLSDRETFVHKLQNKFKNYEFINSSAPNWGLSDYTRYIEDYCKEFDYKKIIIFFNIDDIGRVAISNQYKFLDHKERYIYKKDDIKRGYQHPYEAWYTKYSRIEFIKPLIENIHLIRFTAKSLLNLHRNWFDAQGKRIKKNQKEMINKIKYPQNILKNKNEVDTVIKKSKFILKRLKSFENRCNLDINFIYSGWVDYKNVSNDLNPNIVFLKDHKNIFKDLQFPFYDNVNSLEIKPVHYNIDNYIIKNDHHPNEFGAHLIFQVVKNDVNTILSSK